MESFVEFQNILGCGGLESGKGQEQLRDDVRELWAAGSVACIVPVGVYGVVDGNYVVEADGYFREAGVCRRSVPACLKCALVKD